jgi:hypothetical protein
MTPEAVAVIVKEALVMGPEGVGWGLEAEEGDVELEIEDEPHPGKSEDVASAIAPRTICRRVKMDDGGLGWDRLDSHGLFIMPILLL